MSKERALLKRTKILLECMPMEPLQRQADAIIKEIEERLTQPEHEQQKTDELELKGHIWLLKQLYVGRVVEYHSSKYPNPTLYVHVVKFVPRDWTLGIGVLVNCCNTEHVIRLEEIRL